MYLQLAENAARSEPANPYIYVPTVTPYGKQTTVRVREDLFDDLSDVEYYQLMRELAPYQPAVQNTGLSESGFLADRASRRAKRAQKDADKEEKRALKNEKKAAKNEIKKAKAEKKKAGGGGKFLDTISGVLGKVIGGGGEVVAPEADGGTEPPPPPPPAKSNTGLYIGIGIGVLALGGTIYALTRPKSN